MEIAVLDADRAPVTMLKIPKFYYGRTVSSNRTIYTICPSQTSDTSTVPVAFSPVRNETSDYLYIGVYLGHEEDIDGTPCIGSKVGQTVSLHNYKNTFSMANTVHTDLRDYCAARNDDDAGISGFRIFDAFDWTVLHILGLFMYASTDFPAAAGDDQSADFTTTGSTRARMVFKGTQDNPEVFIDDAWNCTWTHLPYVLIYVNIFNNRTTFYPNRQIWHPTNGQYRHAIAYTDDGFSEEEYLNFMSSAWFRSFNLSYGVTMPILNNRNTANGSLTDTQELATYVNYLAVEIVNIANQGYWYAYGGQYGEEHANTKNGFFTMCLTANQNTNFKVAARLAAN